MTQGLKKKLKITGVIAVALLILILELVSMHKPKKTSEQKETKEEIDEEIANESDDITTPYTSKKSYQVTVNGFLITLGKTTLGEVKAGVGIREEDVKYDKWEYTAKADAQKEIVVNEGKCNVRVTSDKRNTDAWFLVKAYATEMPEDIDNCIVWGVGTDSRSNYKMSNNSYNENATYDEIVGVYGEPQSTTVQTNISEATAPAGTEEEIPQPEIPVENINTQTQSFEAEWFSSPVYVQVNQAKDYRTSYIAIVEE